MSTSTAEKSRKELEAHGWRFHRLLRWHLNKGWVICVPNLFAFGHYCSKGGKTVCYVHYLRGSLKQFALLFRQNLNLGVDIVEFDRNFQRNKTRKYDYSKMLRRFCDG